MRIRPLMSLCMACSFSLTFCNRQSAAAKAKADYQAKEKALDQQLQQNSKNYDQRLKQLETNCGPMAPGFAAPKNAADCAKLKAQWGNDQFQSFVPSKKTPVPTNPKKH
jgi:hypothetical protein